MAADDNTSGKPTSDTDGDVEFPEGKAQRALFSAAATHNEKVNASASLPPTRNQPVTYHMVFVNESRKKKVVQAYFRLDFQRRAGC